MHMPLSMFDAFSFCMFDSSFIIYFSRSENVSIVYFYVLQFSLTKFNW